jgi:hypothetical protein
MTTIRIWLAALVLLSIGACSSTPYFVEQTLSDPSKALVYVYRSKATNPGKKPMRYSYPDIQVDGASLGVLRYNEFLVAELEPGRRDFLATGLSPISDWNQGEARYTQQLEAGKTYYLRLRVEYNTDNMSVGTFKGQYLIHLHALDYNEAVYEIRDASRAAATP